jgi:hypothetical protein
MQNKQFKYYLRKKISAGVYEYYYINSGAVAITPTITEIDFAPKGWSESLLEWERGFDWFGVFTNMSNPFDFVRDGGEILRDIYYTTGVNGNCELYIEKLNDSTQLYDLYYRGELDFSQIEDNTPYVKINVMDGSYMEKLKARKDTTYEVSIDSDPDYFYIKMDGITLTSTLNYTTIIEPTTYPAPLYKLDFYQTIQPTVAYIDGDNSALVGNPETQNSDIQELVLSQANWAMDTFLFTSYRDSDVIADFDFQIAISNNPIGLPNSQDPIKIQVVLYKVSNLGKTINPPAHIFETAAFKNHSTGTTVYNVIDTSAQFSISKREKLGLGIRVLLASGYPTGYGQEWQVGINEGTFTLNFETRLQETYIKALPPENVFDTLVDEISDNEVLKSSTPLVTNKSYAITSGDALRGLTGALIKTNFSNFYTSYNAILNLATYYNKNTNTHLITDKSDVLDGATLVYDIGEVSEFTIKPLTAEMPSSLLLGYPEIRIEGLNGKEAFNNTFEWTTPITRVKTQKDLRCIYIADPFEIELHRANLEGKTTTNSDADNDVFIIHTEAAAAGTYLGKDYYNLYRDATMTINGLLFPDDMFNIELSPKRNMLRNGSYIHSLLHLMDSDYIKFQTSDRNQNLQTILGAVTTTENEDVLISNLDAALFLPIVAEFKCKNPVNIQALLGANPYGYMTLTWKGNQYEVFLLKSSEMPATKASQTIRGILTPNNTLSNLI